MEKITPAEYISLTGCSYGDLAKRTGYSYHAVSRWFMRGDNRREPSPAVPRLLAADLELRRLKCLTS